MKDLRSSGMLRGLGWYLVTDVSGQLIYPIFIGHSASEDFGLLDS